MKSDNIDFEKEFRELLAFSDEKEELEHDAYMLSLDFLYELERLKYDDDLKKKEIASKLNTSPSYITQLFRGDKLLNFITVAKIQKKFDITFEIKAIDNNASYAEQIKNVNTEKMFISHKKNSEILTTLLKTYKLSLVNDQTVLTGGENISSIKIA